MTKRYKLLRDTIIHKAGDVFVFKYAGAHTSDRYESEKKWDFPNCYESYDPRVVENNPDWFAEIKEEKPEFKIMSPAVGIDAESGEQMISTMLFESDTDARDWYGLYGRPSFHSWPAMQVINIPCGAHTEEIVGPIQIKVPVK